MVTRNETIDAHFTSVNRRAYNFYAVSWTETPYKDSACTSKAKQDQNQVDTRSDLLNPPKSPSPIHLHSLCKRFVRCLENVWR